MPKPKCQLGYTRAEVEEIVGNMTSFDRWFRGQAGAICDGRRYDHDKQEYEPTGCGPHGLIYYTWDVEQYMKGQPPLD